MESPVETLNYLRWVPLCPLIGFLVNGLVGPRLGRLAVSLIGCLTIATSFVLSLVAMRTLLALPADQRFLVDHFYTWIQSGAAKWNLQADLAFQLDPLSAVMIIVVSGVGLVIHIYSTGYMHGDPRYPKYFSFLNLFTFNMLLLVLANNILLMFVGWEGVGLCSYLLIGFWFERDSAANAGKKAFIVNRVGDFGFLIGIFLIFVTFRALEFHTIEQMIHTHPGIITAGLATAITLLLFVGATGKSAQIPLYVWLPDAMEGPTPVSALIHAATMVTAGVYMICRTNFLFSLAPTTMLVVAIVGCLTALFAASIGLVQNDIKRVLAYSTISQLGYMFLATGVGAFAAGIFHLMTHAFFKALLFLAAGSVIHAMANEMDIRNMGGLKRWMPITFWTFLIATLAIAGVPGLSGFFSKDEILWQTFSSDHGHWILWLGGVVAALMTAFYMFRLVFVTFFGQCRAKPEVVHHLHESPRSMTVPLMILAFFSIIGGYFGVPHILGGANKFHGFLAPVFGGGHGEEAAIAHTVAATMATHSVAVEWLLMAISVVVALIGIFIAYTFYVRSPETPKKLAERWRKAYRTLLNKYYVDELYDAAFVQSTIRGSTALWRRFDDLIIDGIVNGVGAVIKGWAAGLRRVQTGYVQSYAFFMLLGIFAIIVYLVW